MATFKCKMCAGTLNLKEGVTVVECEYCGIKQTVPSADNEKKMALFTRANKLRFSCDFDKAAGVYESIVVDFPDEAEAYWGLVLCKYGIEYVDDPRTGKKIPTCHRSSFESVMDDSNFEQVMENADPIARSVYRDEAKQIEELRKSIVEVSSKEEPYDIFICYKETDEHGDRTVDSQIAQDVYDALIEKGYRVFFSRITLEDKLGQEYEPYIFAALNSAKVMLAFGTNYEYYNAVWVKNEWSRFLQLIANGEKKMLIPCYKGIDAYDMPKEFTRLQAQDMGKVGAIQDLLRGIEKLFDKQKSGNSAAGNQGKSVATTDSLLKRAFLFLGDGEFKKAEEHLERVLDIDPENADAYIGKLMAEFSVKREADLANLSQRIDLSLNYKKVITYGSADVISRFKAYAATVSGRIDKKTLQLQELESKKKNILREIGRADEEIARSNSVREQIQQQIAEHGKELTGIKEKIEAVKKTISKKQESMGKPYPVWKILIVLAVEIVLCSFFNSGTFSGISSSMFSSVLFLGGLIVLSIIMHIFYRSIEKGTGFGFIIFALGLLVLIITFIVTVGISKIFELILYILYFIFIGWLVSAILPDLVTNPVSPEEWQRSLIISAFVCVLILLAVGIVARIVRIVRNGEIRKASRQIKKMEEDYESMISEDEVLKQLYRKLEDAEQNYKIIFSDNRTRLQALYREYAEMSRRINIRAEQLLPEKFL